MSNDHETLDALLAEQRKTNDLLTQLLYLQQQVWVNTTTERGPDGFLRTNDNAFADLLSAVRHLAAKDSTTP